MPSKGETPVTKLIYSAIASLDGYVEDDQGRFDWVEPDEEVLSFVNDLEGPVGTYLYGCRMYDTMLYWQTPPIEVSRPPFVQDFTKIWQEAKKIVYCRTLESVSSTKTRVERSFEPEAVPDPTQGACLPRRDDRRCRAWTATRLLGRHALLDAPPSPPSDDVSEFLRRVPGCFFFVGAAPPTGPTMHHAATFLIDESALQAGATVLAESALGLATSP
jgi:hypothetical protein